MYKLIQDLCSFKTAIVSDENRPLFNRISAELPLSQLSIPSGQVFNGWVVPEHWTVKKAKLFKDDVEVFDGLSNALGVGYYSNSFTGELSWDELRPHLVSNPDLVDGYMFHCMWQYRPWAADWSFSMPHKVYETLGPGNYRVELETHREPGEMLIGIADIKGKSAKIIVFNSNNCHPHMANDGFAGTAVLIRLMQWLETQDTHYSYRLVIAPEHLGSVFYLRDLPQKEVNNLVGGIFEEMPGTMGALKATKTFNGDTKLDMAMANALEQYSKAHEIVSWRCGAGNDETVWEAPGYEVPFIELTRCEDQFAPYREYHSSLDTPELMDEAQLEETLEIMKRTMFALENDAFVQRNFDGLICLSNPEYDLYMERPDPTITKDLEADAEKWGHLLDNMFRYMDGNMTILEIAQKHDLPFDRLHSYLKRFEEKKLVSLTFAEIERKIPHRVSGIS